MEAERLDRRRVPSEMGVHAGQVDALQVEPFQRLAQRGHRNAGLVGVGHLSQRVALGELAGGLDVRQVGPQPQPHVRRAAQPPCRGRGGGQLLDAVHRETGAGRDRPEDQRLGLGRPVDRDQLRRRAGLERDLELVGTEHVAARAFVVQYAAKRNGGIGLERDQQAGGAVGPRVVEGRAPGAHVRAQSRLGGDVERGAEADGQVGCRDRLDHQPAAVLVDRIHGSAYRGPAGLGRRPRALRGRPPRGLDGAQPSVRCVMRCWFPDGSRNPASTP